MHFFCAPTACTGCNQVIQSLGCALPRTSPKSSPPNSSHQLNPQKTLLTHLLRFSAAAISANVCSSLDSAASRVCACWGVNGICTVVSPRCSASCVLSAVRLFWQWVCAGVWARGRQFSTQVGVARRQQCQGVHGRLGMHDGSCCCEPTCACVGRAALMLLLTRRCRHQQPLSLLHAYRPAAAGIAPRYC